MRASGHDGVRCVWIADADLVLSEPQGRHRQARIPVNGKLPMKPTPISPEMASPAMVPLNSSVSGIGSVMDIFQATSLPLTVPSKISVELPSAPYVPVSVAPALFRLSVALRSPIGVVMVRFQFPSTAIRLSSSSLQNG